MPITIVAKRKTEPTCPSQHKCLVPIRVTGFDRIPSLFEKDYQEQVEVGDILMAMPSKWMRVDGIFNCTKGCLIDKRLNECVRCVRAYEIEQVVLANDNEPAPIT